MVMDTAVLFSGGKDSTLALYYALNYSNVKCLISIISKNPFSYMFHTPNIELVKEQSKALDIPLIVVKSKGEKEKELKDLERAIKLAIKRYKIKGIISGAVLSNYQVSRIQRICNKLGIECFNPLWQKDQFKLLEELVKLKFRVIITGVFALGFDNFLGKTINMDFINAMKKLNKLYKINPAGEGGEYESFVLDAPIFKKRLVITKKHKKKIDENTSLLIIDKLKLVKK